MPITAPLRRSPEDLARLGVEILLRQIQPLLDPQQEGKFIAIAVDSGDYQIDDDDLTAVTHLLARRPNADVWLTRVGQRATYRIGTSR